MVAVVLVDDHPALLEGMARRIEAEADLTLTGRAPSAEEALALIAEDGQPDVLITDYALPGMNGLELIGTVHDRWPELPILMVSTHAERIYAPKALEAGACGYLMKNAVATQLIQAVRQVAREELYLSDELDLE